MIKYKYRDLKRFIKFIKKTLKIKTKIKVKFIKGCGRLAFNYTEEGETKTIYTFGAYDTDKKKIYIPLLLDTIDLYTSIGHEFTHVWQIENNLKLSHDEAELKAIELYEKWIGEG